MIGTDNFIELVEIYTKNVNSYPTLYGLRKIFVNKNLILSFSENIKLKKKMQRNEKLLPELDRRQIYTKIHLQAYGTSSTYIDVVGGPEILQDKLNREKKDA